VPSPARRGFSRNPERSFTRHGQPPPRRRTQLFQGLRVANRVSHRSFATMLVSERRSAGSVVSCGPLGSPDLNYHGSLKLAQVSFRRPHQTGRQLSRTVTRRCPGCRRGGWSPEFRPGRPCGPLQATADGPDGHRGGRPIVSDEARSRRRTGAASALGVAHPDPPRLIERCRNLPFLATRGESDGQVKVEFHSWFRYTSTALQALVQRLSLDGDGIDPSGRLRCSARTKSQVPVRDASDVVVEVELPGVGAQAHLVDLFQALEGDPGLDEVGGEHAAGEQVVLIGFQGGEGLLE
jgi:hypothetical protein